MGTPYAVMAGLLAALLGLWALTASDEEPAAPPRTAPVEVIARRVEALRGLRFERLPVPQAVTPAQARREGLQDLDRSYPAARRRADEEVLKLLGLIEPDVDLREVSATIFGEGVAGYYDPRSKRLRTVTGAATGTRVLAEIVLAHELTHALEDQRFGLRVDRLETGDDRALAYASLVEGTATELMFRYAERHFSAEEALGGLLATAFQDTGALPGFIQAQLTFPYVGGEALVEELLDRAGGRWDLVDLAHRVRPPASTEQVMHPEAYVGVDAPRRVRLRVGEVLGEGWRRRAAGAWGELRTRELLATAGGGGSADAARGWGGDRYELWRSAGASAGCPAPCTRGDALVMRWRWDTRRDEREFAAKLHGYVEDGLRASPSAAGERVWTLRGGAVATARRAGAVTLAFAPDPTTARRLALAG
jgi:hypothetical protein